MHRKKKSKRAVAKPDPSSPKPESPKRDMPATYRPQGTKYPLGFIPNKPDGRAERAFRFWSQTFLKAYANSGSISAACMATGISKRTLAKYRANNPDFDDEVLKIKCAVGGALESSLIERAIDGWDEPIYYRGELVGVQRRFDNALGWNLLQKLNPEEYGPAAKDVSNEAIEMAIAIQNAVKGMLDSVPEAPPSLEMPKAEETDITIPDSDKEDPNP